MLETSIRNHQTPAQHLSWKNKSSGWFRKILPVGSQNHTMQISRCSLCTWYNPALNSNFKMLASRFYMEQHNQEAGIEDRNICAEKELEGQWRSWETEWGMMSDIRSKCQIVMTNRLDFLFELRVFICSNPSNRICPKIIYVVSHRRSVGLKQPATSE